MATLEPKGGLTKKDARDCITHRPALGKNIQQVVYRRAKLALGGWRDRGGGERRGHREGEAVLAWLRRRRACTCTPSRAKHAPGRASLRLRREGTRLGVLVYGWVW